MINFIEKFGESPEREPNSFTGETGKIEAFLGDGLHRSVIKYISLIFNRVNGISWVRHHCSFNMYFIF